MNFEDNFLPQKFNIIPIITGLLNVFLYSYMILFVCFSIIFSGARVTGTSMQPTFHSSGDVVYYNKFEAFDYGDVVVVHKNTSNNYDIIKRVIAKSGDKLNYLLDEESQTYVVFVNGNRLNEPYTMPLTVENLNSSYYDDPLYKLRQFNADDFEMKDLETDFGEGAYVVPEGCVFVMGDNRPDSSDSRLSGAYEISNVYGVVEYVIPKGTNKYLYFAKKLLGI